MSSLLHPLQTASQKCRPKHQVLILRCYPQYQKNVQEIKPNSSELSYLLYYTSTRRSKLSKVGAFLEKKTANDVWRQKLGNVQVTLQILTAIIEKSPRDLSLYANSVLTIIDHVLRSKDINMVEETLPTFETYCKHVDVPSLLADQRRAKQYLSIVQLYASFASPDQVNKGRGTPSVPLYIRWRTVALKAIRAVVGSEAISVDSSTQLNAVMPVILENLSLQDGEVLKVLQERAHTGEKESSENARRRRMSIATVATIDTVDANPAMASETTADADKVAEEEVRVLAVRCLKHIFSVSPSSSRGQTRLATALTLKFIAAKQRPQSWLQEGFDFRTTWAATLFEAIARWTPVQDRFVIVLTAMETLVRSPIIESVLEKQLVLAQMIDHLLQSDVNLIGLSVMDVLLGLIQHMLLLLQIGGRDTKLGSPPHLPDVLGFTIETKETFDPQDIVVQPDINQTVTKDEISASPTRKQLLNVLESCVSDLSNHIYYTDQISDMITAILARLKPSSHSEVSSIAAAINNPTAASKSIADSASLRDDSATDNFFSFATARVIALKAVKDILVTANNRRTKTGASAEARSRVGVHVWEGTQWLLKDEDSEVRFAYVDAILTWLKLETNKTSLLLPQANNRKNRWSKKPASEQDDLKIAKRAISNASKKDHTLAQSTFIQLLHLSIHDQALERAESEQEILLLHLLLSTLVERLGVNVLRSGLPMIMELQNTALNVDSDRSARSKINLGSLVHGYLWSTIDKFDLANIKAGQEVLTQISKRKQHGAWMNSIKIPALSFDQISEIEESLNEKEPSAEGADSMKPFLDVAPFVDGIANAYDDSLFTPPSSPALSPARMFSVPSLGFGYGYGAVQATRPSHRDQMPQNVKDEMVGQWSRDSCLAHLTRERSSSLAGSKAGTSSGRKQHLTVTASNGEHSGRESPASPGETNIPPHQISSGLGSFNKHHTGGWSGSALQLTTSSERDSIVKVSDLKRTLSAVNFAHRNSSPLRRPLTASRRSLRESDADSESMLSWNEADDVDGPTGIGQAHRPGTSSSRKEAHASDGHTTSNKNSDIPPVPKIPSTLNLPGTWPRDTSLTRTGPNGAPAESAQPSSGTRHIVISSNAPLPNNPASTGSKRTSRPTSRAEAASIRSTRSQTFTVSSTKATDVKAALAGFLAGIEVDPRNGAADAPKEVGRKRLVSPPY